MRTLLTKFFALGLVGFIAFGILPVGPAKAQTQAQINAVVAAAAGGDTQAIARFLSDNKGNPGLAQLVGNAVASQLSLNTANSQALANALVATGDVALISGVMAANGIGTGAQSAVARSLVSSGNVTLIATVEASLSSVGATGALGVLTTQVAASPLVVALVSAGTPPTPIAIAVISPAQTLCSGSCA